ncbi:unnamed protein product [Camellia sinensis]
MNQRAYHEVYPVRVKHTLLLKCSDLETILRRFGNHSEAICDLEIKTNEEIFLVSPIVSKEITSVSINNLIPNRFPANPSPFRSTFPVSFIFNKLANETYVASHHQRLRRRETSFSKKKKIEKVEFVIEPTTHESENQLKVKPESNIDNEEPKQEQLKQPTELHKPRGKKKINGRKTRTEQIHDNEAKYVYRSNIQSLIKFFKTTKLREEHLTVLRKTPFSLLVDTLSENKVKRRDSIKYDDVVAKILQTYQMDGTTFEIAGKKLKLKRNDFKLIFGIACGQKSMNLAYGRKNEVVMVQRRKITESRMTSASIQKLIPKLLRSNNNEDVEDVVRHVCLLVCLLLLYPGTGTTIGWGFMKYLENIDEMKSYDWCGAAKQHLTRSIARNINQIDRVCGCVIILLHAKIIKPNDKNPIPRFARWNITHLGEQLAKSSLHDLKHIEESNLKDTIEEQNIYKQLQPQIDDEHEDEECNFEEQEETELSEKEEEPIITKLFSLSPGRNSPNPKHQTGARKKRKLTTLQSKKNARRKANFQHETEEGPVHVQRNGLSFDNLENDEEETMVKQKVGPTTSLRFKHQTPADKRKAKRKLAYETNIYHVKINEHTFQKLEENVLIIQRLKMEKARIQAENDELKDQLMKLSKQMEEQSKKAKIQMEVKDVEMVLLNERIAMFVESNLYLDSEEEQIVVEVEATTPKTSPLVSSMIKRVKNRETRKEHKDPNFWYVTKRQPKQNKTVDELEPMVEESVKTRKEEQTQHQRPTKQIDTSYLVFHKLPKKSRMKLTSLYYPILQGKEVDSYLYLDDIDKIVKCEELFGNAINVYKEILMTEEQLKPKFSLSSQAGTIYIFTTSCHDEAETNQLLNNMMLEAVKERYLLFPVFNEKHWTLLVLDTKNGLWKFYNSMRPSTETDNHLNEANKVRKVIEKYLQYHNLKLIEVCYLMREYVCNKDIFPNLTKEECHQIRANIIDALLTNQQTDTQQIVDEAIEAVLEDKEFWDTIHKDNHA